MDRMNGNCEITYSPKEYNRGHAIFKTGRNSKDDKEITKAGIPISA